ncbi:hypothetical protein B0A48_04475 [Cryoendolithus antarcticus]|uniref:Cation/H+ exchanger transmembrane domain-containing protein n=1 Tax=Cryoendolithus antarcticus TaxID=1507870 RepID=A0A1V8TFT0_9PEZI|nr:hypothetical protein B0A48_04475 [Cryoendolithus antarcticus]
MSTSPSALSYHEPSISTLLVLSSFLLLLNFLNFLLNKVLYCGLIGQILLGILYGIPGANWLSLEVQDAVMQLGYIGLILVVYEGGLTTDITTLKSTLALSSLVATIGISLPVALSFVLIKLLPVTPLQAFAAGAALCSTSLGTTFTVLTTSGLTESRLGVVLTSAAMMDDVVGLVMVQVISNLGRKGDFRAVTVVRPVLVSIGFAVVLVVGCKWFVGPALRVLQLRLQGNEGRAGMVLSRTETAFVMHTAVLVGLVTGATYAGTSGLFAAYLAGALVTWLSDLSYRVDPADGPAVGLRSPAQATNGDISCGNLQIPEIVASARAGDKTERRSTGKEVYEDYYHQIVEKVLKPFFFASIGCSIPITKMFAAPVIWRGAVYSILMIVGKLACGLCLVRFASATSDSKPTHGKSQRSKGMTQSDPAATEVSLQDLSPSARIATASPPASQQDSRSSTQVAANTSRKRSRRTAPLSLYPAAILGSAMVARGEIGFLISAVAESQGIYGADDGPSELFFIVTWAVLVCTIIGPVVVGLLVKRVKRLQERERRKSSGREDPLGVWGVVI